MVSTFSPNRNLELQATGDNVDAWGAILNSNVFTKLDQILGSTVAIAVTNVDVTITTAQFQNLRFDVTGIKTADVNIILPDARGGFFYVSNASTGAFKLNIKTANAGTNTIVLPVGGVWIMTNGVTVALVEYPGDVLSIASAATTDLGTILTRRASITGVAAISSFGSTASTLQPLYFFTFTGVLVLTNGAALLLPGGINITTAAGDWGIAIYLGAGNWQVIGYFKASGLPVIVKHAPSVRQTVETGSTDSNGLPNFLPATSVNLNLTSQNDNVVSRVVAAAGGFDVNGPIDVMGIISANQTWTGLTASQTNYLFETVNSDGTCTTGFTIVPPIYQRGGTISVTSGQYTFDISQMKMFLGNGATAPAVNVVFVGEAVTSGVAVTATLCYAYRGQYRGPATTPIIISGGTRTAFADNLGVPVEEKLFTLRFKAVNAVGNYTVGMLTKLYSIPAGGSAADIPNTVEDRNTSSTVAGTAATPMVYYNRTTGAQTTAVAADWSYAPFVQRNF